ncbi:hypothetical protein JXB27_03235 [Candidatus Woesearchaeota archaeon]|nr:hypothetical protein [Candidatus Woesearchaeota archaeon]
MDKSLNLVEGLEKVHYGKYVVVPSFSDRHVIAYDKNPLRALKKAEKAGYEEPVLIYVPNPKIPHYYFCGLERRIA